MPFVREISEGLGVVEGHRWVGRPRAKTYPACQFASLRGIALSQNIHLRDGQVRGPRATRSADNFCTLCCVRFGGRLAPECGFHESDKRKFVCLAQDESYLGTLVAHA